MFSVDIEVTTTLQDFEIHILLKYCSEEMRIDSSLCFLYMKIKEFIWFISDVCLNPVSSVQLRKLRLGKD